MLYLDLNDMFDNRSLIYEEVKLDIYSVFSFIINEAIIRIHFSATITIIFLMTWELFKNTLFLLWNHTMFPDYRLFQWFLWFHDKHSTRCWKWPHWWQSWVLGGATWLFPVSINAAGPTMYCVHPPIGLDFASAVYGGGDCGGNLRICSLRPGRLRVRISFRRIMS